MEFSIGTQFSREFSFDETSIIVEKLSSSLNEKFKGINDDSDVEKIYIGLLCVSSQFEPFFKPRSFKVLKDESAFEYELKIDFEIIKNATFEERIKIISNELFQQTRELLNKKKFKKFNSNKFITELENWLSSII